MRLLVAVMLAALLAGCGPPLDVQIANECTNRGFEPGTLAFQQCVELDWQARELRMQEWNAISREGFCMMQGHC